MNIRSSWENISRVGACPTVAGQVDAFRKMAFCIAGTQFFTGAGFFTVKAQQIAAVWQEAVVINGGIDFVPGVAADAGAQRHHFFVEHKPGLAGLQTAGQSRSLSPVADTGDAVHIVNGTAAGPVIDVLGIRHEPVVVTGIHAGIVPVYRGSGQALHICRGVEIAAILVGIRGIQISSSIGNMPEIFTLTIQVLIAGDTLTVHRNPQSPACGEMYGFGRHTVILMQDERTPCGSCIPQDVLNQRNYGGLKPVFT